MSPRTTESRACPVCSDSIKQLCPYCIVKILVDYFSNLILKELTWFKILLIFSKNLFFVIILQLDLWAIDLVGDLTNYQENGEFKLEQVTAEKNCVYYSCCINPFPDLTYYIELRRRPMFYVFNLILPCVLINGIGKVLTIYSFQNIFFDQEYWTCASQMIPTKTT